MNAGIFLVATQGNIHALSISPKGLIMGMLLAITRRNVHAEDKDETD